MVKIIFIVKNSEYIAITTTPLLFWFRTKKINKNDNNKFEKINHIEINNLSNIDYNFPKWSLFNFIYNDKTKKLIYSYYKQRIKKLK